MELRTSRHLEITEIGSSPLVEHWTSSNFPTGWAFGHVQLRTSWALGHVQLHKLSNVGQSYVIHCTWGREHKKLSATWIQTLSSHSIMSDRSRCMCRVHKTMIRAACAQVMHNSGSETQLLGSRLDLVCYDLFYKPRTTYRMSHIKYCSVSYIYLPKVRSRKWVNYSTRNSNITTEDSSI